MTERFSASEYAAIARKRPHYRANPKRTADGYFGSAGELRDWENLRLLEKAGEIKDLKCHTRIPIYVNGCLIKHYRTDFTYVNCRNGKFTVRDYKGQQGKVKREWVLTKKLLRALNPDWEIIES